MRYSPPRQKGGCGCRRIRRICGIDVLRALERGEGPTEIARRFEVSRIWVYQVRDRWQKTGERCSLPIGGHRRSRLADAEPVLRKWIAAQPDLTLGRTAAAAGRTGAVGQDRGLVAPVKPLEAHLQKKRCTPASKSARTCRRRGAPGSKGSPFWICESSYFWMKRGRPPT